MLLITIQEPGRSAVCHRLENRIVLIGRSLDAGVTLHDFSVSRSHLEIRREAGGWAVRDLGSSNGTFLNGSPVRGTEPLSPGDEVRAGDVVLIVDEERPVETTVFERATDRADRASEDGQPVMVGRSGAIRAVRDAIERVAPSEATVLITGPNGAGKELVARLIHLRSSRAEGPFVVVNCPALPGSLIESELFGVEKGVATGVEARPGRFEMAGGGTLLLDEIGDLEPGAQAKILRAIEEKQLERVGGREVVPFDARILACTNHDLEADIGKGTFRRDLFHRLNTVHIRVPALAERREDLPLLVEHFLGVTEGPGREMGPEAMALLLDYHFPGNVRELRRIVERAVLFARDPVIGPDDLPEEVCGTAVTGEEATRPGEVSDLLYRRIVGEGASFWEAVREPFLSRELPAEAVRSLVERARREGGGSYKGAARVLGLEGEYKKFLNFLQYHKLQRKD